jgi:HD-GYP domain-containing protein (c-di-GMP phosphodiesterase class II)
MALWSGRLRLSELLASLSLASDLGTGQPLGHGIRTCLLAVALAEEMGCPSQEVRVIHQVALLRFLGCTSDSGETARLAGGDDLAFNAAMAPVFNGGSGESLRGMIGAIGVGGPLPRRLGLVASALADPGGAAQGLAAHCEVAAMFASRLGLDSDVVEALAHAYERWDGRGYPGGLKEEQVPRAVRIVTVARDAGLLAAMGNEAADLFRRRRGRAYDPAVVDALGRLPPRRPEAEWDLVLAAEPEPVALIADLDLALSVLADFVDLKSAWTRGHSRRVSELVESAALSAGLGPEESSTLRRAGLVHDAGRVGVENGIWDKPGPLSTDEWERVRLHPYLTQRILGRWGPVAGIAEVASSHHERQDGSGYHRQIGADHLPIGARLIAAADVHAALTAPRPQRGAMSLDRAAKVLEEEVDAGRLDSRGVALIRAAAEGTAPRPLNHRGGLSPRETEVLRLLSAGNTNRQIGEKLFISPKTVGRHVENIYAKIGVSTRAGAAVYAMENRLLE